MSSSSECGTPHACSNTICSSAVPGLERRREEYCRAACHEIMLQAAWGVKRLSSAGQCASVQRSATALVRQASVHPAAPVPHVARSAAADCALHREGRRRDARRNIVF